METDSIVKAKQAVSASRCDTRGRTSGESPDCRKAAISEHVEPKFAYVYFCPLALREPMMASPRSVA